MAKSTKTYRPLDELIDSSGLKYEVIAEKMGIPYNRFWRIRVNPRKMGVDEMEKLAEILGVGFTDVYKVHKKFRQEVDKNTTKVS